MFGNYIVSLIRTYVPVGVGIGLTWLSLNFGIVLDEQTSGYVTLGAVGLAAATYYAAARLVEQRWPGVGGVLLTLGLARKTAPVYPPKDAVRR